MFASALDWPGWCRSGRSEQQALRALAEYAGRYAVVGAGAGFSLAREAVGLDVVERVRGNVTTDFGAPAVIAAADREPLDPAGAARVASLLAGCWTAFALVVSKAPSELRKGPRGGGRDRDEIVDHVAAAELAYARKLGIRRGADLAASRDALLAVLAASSTGSSPDAKGWPPRYAARRIAWHVLDHAWEIEDKS